MLEQERTIDLGNAGCAKCGLCYGRANVVNGKGSLNAKILFVGEWPGTPEDRTGDVSSGPIAEELYRLADKAGIDRSKIFLTTTVRCIPKAPPPQRIRKPDKDEIKACADYLDKEIFAIRPNVIVPMGSVAVCRVLGKVVTIKKTRGTEIWSDKYNCKVIPIYHPLMIRRKPEFEGFTVEDLRAINKSSESPSLTPKSLGVYKVIDSIEGFDKLIGRLNSIKLFSYDIETTGLNFTKDKVLCISFSGKEKTGITVPLVRYTPRYEEETFIKKQKIRRKNKKTGKFESRGVKEVKEVRKIKIDTYSDYWGDKQNYIIDKLKDVFKNNAVKIAHNGKFDNKFLYKNFGITVSRFVDTMLMHFLIDENMEGMHGLKECAWVYTDMGGYEAPLDQWFKEKKIPDKKKNYAYLPASMLYEYAAKDVDCTIRLYNIFAPRLVEEKLGDFYNTWMKPVNDVLMQAELRGILMDKDYNEKISSIMEKEIAHRERVLKSKWGDINFGSGDQLGELLFTKLKLPVLKETAGGKRSTDEETLNTLSQKHDDLLAEYKKTRDQDLVEDIKKFSIAKEVLNHRKVKNTLSKYVIGLRDRTDKNFVIHTTFLLHGTVTGRLSSTNPNMQNMPKVSVDGRIKNQFIPRPGYIFIEADYGQAEFRHWANYSQDQDMIRDIIAADNGTGPDIHLKTASEAWHIPLDQVTKVQRNNAKRVVFGIMYGRQAESIAEQLGITPEEAQTIIDQFLARYPIAAGWLKAAIREVQRAKQIRNIFGRIRRLPGINSPIEFVRTEQERLAMNSPIQSAASDMNCLAATRISKRFKRESMDGHLLNMVHDSTLYEVPKDKVNNFAKIIQEEMESPIPGVTVPMKVELKVGERWGEMKDYILEEVAA